MTTLKSRSKRFNQIISILSKYKLADWFQTSTSEAIRTRLKGADGEDLIGLSQKVRLRMALTELGTTFIKLGQVLSTRPDLIGPEVAEELSKLQADVPADSFEDIQKTIQEDYGRPLEAVFETFEKIPVASASIGQVHFATLNGKAVVVKVQHRGIDEVVAKDLDILATLAAIAEGASEEIRQYEPREFASAFRRSLLAEMNFVNEMRHLRRFRDNFSDNAFCYFPEVFPELTTRRVCPQERLTGFSVADAEKLEKSETDRKAFVLHLAGAYMDMIFRDGIYHADPHPGNIFVQEGSVVGFLDFGAVGRVGQEMQDNFEGLMIALFDQDPNDLTDEIVRIGTVPDNLDRSKLRRDISELVATYLGVPIKEIDLSALSYTLFETVRKHRIAFPPNISMLVKVLGQIDGTCRLVDGDFQFMDVLGSYYGKIIEKRLSKEALLKRARKSVRYWMRLIDLLPRQLVLALEAVEKKSFHLKMQHKGLDQITNRIVYALLSVALIFSGTEMLGARITPMVWNASLPGVAAYGGGLFLAARVLRAVTASGGLKSSNRN